jgi:hypothetical protein
MKACFVLGKNWLGPRAVRFHQFIFSRGIEVCGFCCQDVAAACVVACSQSICFNWVELKGNQIITWSTYTGVLISPQPDQEGNGSAGTCNPEETGLPGLPTSWSPTLFSGSGPVGLPPVPWTKKTIEREVGWAEDLLAPCNINLYET